MAESESVRPAGTGQVLMTHVHDNSRRKGSCIQATVPRHAVRTCVWVHKCDAPGALGSHVGAKHTNPQHCSCSTGRAGPADRGCAVGGVSIQAGARCCHRAAPQLHHGCLPSIRYSTRGLAPAPRCQQQQQQQQQQRRPPGSTIGADGGCGCQERQEPAHVEQAHAGIQPDAMVVQASHTPAGRCAGGQAGKGPGRQGGQHQIQVHRRVPPTQQPLSHPANPQQRPPATGGAVLGARGARDAAGPAVRPVCGIQQAVSRVKGPMRLQVGGGDGTRICKAGGQKQRQAGQCCCGARVPAAGRVGGW